MPNQIGEALKWGREALKTAGLEDYNISADLLLQSVLDLTRSQLLLNNNSEIFPSDFNKYRKLISQRANHVPLQYLIGWVEFYNIKIQIDNRALIPRPETEILVETVIQKLHKIYSPAILDIGTGSGNIAIALAKNIVESAVTGIDISGDVLDLARSNAKLNLVENSSHWIVGDIKDQDFVKSIGKFNCVVSNPPYVSFAEKDKLQPEVIEYEPSVALFSGEDPLIFYRTIVGFSSYIVNLGGLLAFEVGMGQAGDVAALMKANFKDVEITRDLAGIERVVTGVYAGIG